MLAMVMLAYAVCVLVGESIRDVQYAQVSPDDLDLLKIPEMDKSSRWHLFSGPFLLIQQRFRLDRQTLRKIVAIALLIFSHLVFANVRTLVRT